MKCTGPELDLIIASSKQEKHLHVSKVNFGMIDMLVLFYLSVFYLSCLKRLESKYERAQEVNSWFVQMMCYHASLLLKLSNDVEENPGPTTIDEIVDNN